MPQKNERLYKHLMQALTDQKSELELKLTGCANDTDTQVSQDIQRELWVTVGVKKFGLQSDLLQKVAQRFAEIGKVPKGYPPNE